MVADRRPSMSLYPSPWLDKPAALRVLWRLVSATAVGELGLVGYLDTAIWQPPASGAVAALVEPAPRFDAPESALDDAFGHLSDVRRSLPPGTFVFVCSDFLAPPDPACWARALAYRWDVVPVVLQDPVWEQSFPDVDGVVVPFADPGGRRHGVRLRRGESADRRRTNEERIAGLVGELRAFGLEPVVLDRSDDAAVLDALSAWGETRLAVRRGEW
jgi:hypothetical protein